MKQKLLLFVFLVFAAIPLWAQEAAEEAAEAADETVMFTTAPQFFVAVIAGVILAAAFQLILTNLSIAAGLNLTGAAIGPDRKDDRSKEHAKERAKDQKKAGENALDSAQSTVRKLTSVFGIWTLVTATISMFFAAWLAVLLSGTFSVIFGALLGLVIWGLFTILMMTLEVNAVTSLFGAMARMARGAMQSITSATSSLFTKSKQQEAVDTARDMAAAVREEILGDDNISTQIRKYLKGVESSFHPKRIRKELEDLLDDTEIEFLHSETDEERLIATIHSGGTVKPETARKMAGGIKEAIASIREERARGKSGTGAVVDTGLRMAGVSPDQASVFQQQLEEHLRRTGKPELNPDAIKQDLERLFSEPRAGMQSLKERAKSIDRSTVVAVLEERTDLDHDEAERIVDQVVETTRSITGMGSSVSTAQQGPQMRDRVEQKLRSFLDSLGKPELGYEEVKNDLLNLFKDPVHSSQALVSRFKAIDRDTIRAMLAQRKDLSEEDAENLIRRVEDVRDTIIEREQRIVSEIQRRAEMAKLEAQEQAQELAKTAALAAWWAFATAVISAAAAVIGGIMPAM